MNSPRLGPVSFCAFVLLLSLSGCAAQPEADGPVLNGYIASIPRESRADRQQRRQRIVQRRGDTIIMVHRGASRVATENTLEAYAAAMDLGADGCEIDIRRTTDGVLYVHHDDKLGRTIEGSEAIRSLSYADLLSRPMKGKGINRQTHPPTLAAIAALARQRAMLLHLDVKEPGLEDDIIRWLEEADLWDHVVHITAAPHSDRLRADKRLKLLDYKGWLNEAGTTEDSIRQFLARPSQMIFVKDDPTEAVKLLNRTAGPAVPLPNNIRQHWTAQGPVGKPF